MRDSISNFSTVGLLGTGVAVVAPTNLTEADLMEGGYAVDAFHVCVRTSAIGGPNGTLKLQHSDVGGGAGFVDVPLAETLRNFPLDTLAAGTVTMVGYRGSKRFVRGVITPDVSATVIAFDIRLLPSRAPVNPPIA